MAIWLIFLMGTKTVAQNPPMLWADSCLSGSFYGKIISEGYSDFSQVHEYANGDFILVGTIKRKFAQLEIQKNYCHVMRIQADGNLLWSKFVGIADSSLQVDLRTYTSLLTANGDLLMVLAINAVPVSGNYVVRMDGNGRMVWQKKLPYLNNTLFSETFKDVIETRDSGFVITGAASDEGVFIKLDANGEMVWRRSLVSWSTDINGVTEGDNGYYLTGDITNRNNGFVENYFARADKNSGAITNMRWISLAGTVPLSQVAEFKFDHMRFQSGRIAITGSTRYNYNGTNNNAQVVVYADENGTVVSAKRIENIATEQAPAGNFQGMLLDPFFNSGVQFNVTDSSDYYVYKFGTDNNATLARRILQPGAQVANDLRISHDSSIIIAGYSRNLTQNVSANVLKTSTRGRLENCANDQYAIDITNQTVVMVDNSNVWNSVPEPGNTVSFTLDTIEGNGFTWQLDCNNNSSCRVSKIQGAATVCQAASNIFFVARNGCSGMVDFSTTDPAAVISRLSDSAVQVTFSQSGNYLIRAGMQASCGKLTDSMLVNVTNSNGTISLGADRELCTANTILLKLSGNFSNYLWQDGSTDTSFLVSAPGRYFVAVDGVCGGHLQDTINIYAAVSNNFTVGADRTKCNQDTLQLKATAGYSNYSWKPGYQIISNSGQRVVINPLVDTVYTVSATLYPGCLVFDTVRINVNAAPVINLGTDRTICPGEKIVLTACGAFAQYRWNDGSIGKTNIVSKAGLVVVAGYAENGCVVSDSIRIIQKVCLEDVYIPNVFTPNGDGWNELFKPLTSLSLKHYRFQVFNRWGKKLFESTEPGVGWDGRFSGEPIGPATLVWVCSYQIDGRAPVVKKGSVILMR